MAADNSSALTGALGAVLGYLGSEVAEVVLFERLFWPERYYNDFSFKVALQQCFLMTMGGPLHAAALKALDTFRENGLYMGTSRGDMLGTAFYADKHTTYSVGSADDRETDETRNAFWVEVARFMDKSFMEGYITADESSSPGQNDNGTPARPVRAFKGFYSLELGAVLPNESPAEEVDCVSEDGVTWKTFVCIFLSESIAIGVGIGAIFLGVPWMVIVMSIPLLLKIISAAITVRRKGLLSLPQLEMHGSDTELDVFDTFMHRHGFLLIKGPKPLVQQFFQHYGHPDRDGTSFPGNRSREVLAMVLLYCFVFNFPAGLVFIFWMKSSVQYLWLAYQLYAVLAMHLVRILDWQGTGRTEERVAKSLTRERIVWLQWPKRTTVSAKVEKDVVRNMKEGQERVQEILSRHYDQSQSHVGSSQCARVSQGIAVPSDDSVLGNGTEPGKGRWVLLLLRPSFLALLRTNS